MFIVKVITYPDGIVNSQYVPFLAEVFALEFIKILKKNNIMAFMVTP